MYDVSETLLLYILGDFEGVVLKRTAINARNDGRELYAYISNDECNFNSFVCVLVIVDVFHVDY